MEPELRALGQVAFRTAYAGNDIWRDDVIHVDGIHSWAFHRVLETLDRVRDGAPVGNLVIQGRPGIGQIALSGTRPPRGDRAGSGLRPLSAQYRTPVLGQSGACLRGCPASIGGWGAAGGTQLSAVLHGLGAAIGLQETEIEDLAAGTFDVSHLKDVRRSLQLHLGRRPADRVAVDVALALILTNSEDPAHQDIRRRLDSRAGNLMTTRRARMPSQREADSVPGHRQCIRPARGRLRAHDPCRGRSARRTGRARTVAFRRRAALVARPNGHRAHGLLREDVQHSLVVLSCLNDSWTLFRERSVATAHHRYPAVV